MHAPVWISQHRTSLSSPPLTRMPTVWLEAEDSTLVVSHNRRGVVIMLDHLKVPDTDRSVVAASNSCAFNHFKTSDCTKLPLGR
jgi:hypothetical protein